MSAQLPQPSGLSTRTAMISAFQAAPANQSALFARAAMIPATWVPW